MTDPDGGTYAYGYTNVMIPSPNLLVSVAYPGGAPAPTTQYLYENPAFPKALTGIVDEDGNRYTSWTYDANKRVASSEHAGGADLTSFSYNISSGGGGSGTVTVTNPLGRETIYTLSYLNAVGKPTKAAEQASAHAPAATSTIAYDTDGHISQRVDDNGNTTNYTNDSRGMVLSETDAAGSAVARTTTTTWLSTFHLPTEIVAPGRTTSFTYDASGNLLTKTETDTTSTSVPYSTNGNTRSWSWSYNATGEVLTATDPLNETTSYGYDASGALVSVTNALGQVTQITSHDASGRPLTLVDANGATTNLAYDPRGRLTSVTAPGGAATTLVYDAAGNLTQITRPDGSFLAYSYDAAHRLTTIADSFGDSIAYTLDPMGDRTAEQITENGGALVKTQSRVFDELGRLIQSIGAAGETTSYSYDKDGNRTGVTDPLSNLTSQSFDALNRLITVAAPLSSTSSFAYDSRDNRTGVTDPRGLATGYVYDGLDDLIELSSPDTGVSVYQVDAAGHRTEATDAAGNLVQMSYDALGRIIARTYPNDPAENVAYHYDEPAAIYGIGRLTSVSDQSGNTSFVYDSRGNVVQETQVIGGLSYTTAYAYDLADHVIEITYPSGRIVSYSRDAMGRITGITTQANANAAPVTVVSGASYLPFGPLAGLTYGNGLVLAVQYDGDYRPTARLVSGVATVQDLTYGYDADSDVTAIADAVNSARSQSFQYDALQRLTSATGLYGTLGYSYDAVGNRLGETGGDTNLAASYAYAGASNQLLSVTNGGVTRRLAYTAAGNLASNDNGSGTVLSFAYNQQNRLAQVTNAGAAVAAYQQDYTGARVAKLAGGVATHYHYDRAGHLIAESDGTTGAAGTEYLWLDDMPVAMVSGSALYFIHPDQLGTPQRVTDANQSVVWDAVLRPFGLPEQLTATFTDNLRFPGQYADAETGLAYNFFRDYDPSIGRYIESDPIGLQGGVNTYSYVRGNPENLADSAGLQVAVPVSPVVPPPGGEVGGLPINAQWPAWLQDWIGKNIVGPLNDAEDTLLSMAKGGKQRKENEYTRAARSQPGDPCEWLQEQYKKARASRDFAAAEKIKLAQKVLGCRRSGASLLVPPRKDSCRSE
jgi:RHS repeat-associated protein